MRGAMKNEAKRSFFMSTLSHRTTKLKEPHRYLGENVHTTQISVQTAPRSGLKETKNPAKSKRNRRRERWQLRQKIAKITNNQRTKFCGQRLLPSTVNGLDGAVLSYGKDTDGYRTTQISNVETCGSSCTCPVCSAKIAIRRAKDYERIVTHALDQGYKVAFVTLTVRHKYGNTLAATGDAVASAWRLGSSGGAWNEDRTALDIKFIRAFEVTHGSNGWHPHQHLLFLYKGSRKDFGYYAFGNETEGKDPDTFIYRFINRYERGLCKAIDSAVDSEVPLDRKKGVDIQHPNTREKAVEKARYLAKEMAFGSQKGDTDTPKTSGLTPFQVIEKYFATGQKSYLAIWYEWEKWARGRRFQATSLGLRNWAGLEVEAAEEELAQEGNEEEFSSLIRPVVILKNWWRDRFREMEMRSLLEEQGPRKFIRWLTEQSIEYEIPPKWLVTT